MCSSSFRRCSRTRSCRPNRPAARRPRRRRPMAPPPLESFGGGQVNIADHAIAAAESPALIIDGGAISYGELYARSQRVAAVLHDAGLRTGDGVALVLPNRSEFFEITW